MSSLRPRASGIEMSKPIMFGVSALVLVLTAIVWRSYESSSSSDLVFNPKLKPPQAGPLCPWREPETDLKLLFPNATRHEVETRILSGLRVELAERLGRAPTGDENALHVYRIYQDKTPLGNVVTRRVKGMYGAIELVLAVDANQRVSGLRLQRLREPESAASALQNPAWLRAFEGKHAGSSWKLGGDIPEVSAEARASAETIVEGARSLLILLAASEQSHSNAPAAEPHH